MKPPSTSPHRALPSPRSPTYRANPFPKVTNPACRIPLRYFVLFARDCSSWRPDADSVRLVHGVSFHSATGFSRAAKGCHKHIEERHALSDHVAWLSAQRILTRADRPSTRRENPSCESQLRHQFRTFVKVAHYAIDQCGNINPLLCRVARTDVP